MIKEVRLEEERKKVIDFLNSNDLLFEDGIELTLYIDDEDGNILATISKEGKTIKCLAVDERYRSENYASTLVSEMINRLYNEGCYHQIVYTKKIYTDLFVNLGFEIIVSTNETAILEHGITNIKEVIKKLRKQIESKLDCNLDKVKVNSLVINANPFTLGHLELAEEALKTCDYLIVFLLEENKSYYSFKERLSLAYISLQMYDNVIVIPSTDYIISSSTFPTYFLKEETKKNKEWMETDVYIFKEYFMKLLNIKYRYVGEEKEPIMVDYNNTLRHLLGDNLVVIPRLDEISASTVRKYVQNGEVDKALEYIPQASKQMFRMISIEKVYGNK